MKVRTGATTDVGKVREGNEDAFLLDEPLFAVADGMGGALGGEVASNLALETVEALFGRGKGSIADQIREANRVVFERSAMDRSVAGMGTTLTAAVVEGAGIRLAHVGDSRCYLLRDDELRLLTQDHTLVHRMVESGEISEEEAKVHPHRSVLTRALGTEPDIAVDEVLVEVRDGDRLLLCSDGLTAMVQEAQLREILVANPDPQDAADRLVRAANRAGGIDNITVVVLDLELEAGDEPADEAERTPAERPAAPRVEAGPSVGKVARNLAIAAVVIVLGLVGVRSYVDRQWYVGVANDHVAVFRGVPTTFLGFDLHRVVVQTQIPASDAERLPLYRTLPDGITTEDRPGADRIVQQIRSDVAAASKPTVAA